MVSVSESVVKEISGQLVSSYIFLEVAEQCVEYMKAQLSSGAFDVNEDTLATILTKGLQDVSHDKHIRVRRKNVAGTGNDEFTREASARENHGFRKMEIFDHNIGYMELHYFAPTAWAAETVIGAMRFVSSTDALIIDLRKNGGGDPGLVAFICSYFFVERTLLNTVYWRQNDFTDQFWTMEYVPGPLYIDRPVYILTSSDTFSAAEEFAYSLKNLNRARTVGEVTKGGAHPVDVIELPAGLEIVLPKGRAINPITKDNWEGSGVAPTIESSADSALDVALAEIRSILG